MAYILDAEPLTKTASFASTLKRDRLRSLLEDTDTPGSILLIICLDHFGTEFFDWEPDTLRLELKDELNADPSQVNYDKIWALVTYLTTDSFFQSLEVFIPTCNVLSNSEASFTDFDPADTEEMAWAITELNLIDPIEKPAEQFSEEIKTYVSAQIQADGLVRLPPMLAWGRLEGEPEDRVTLMEDDPPMFNAVWDHQQKNQKAVLQYVDSRLGELFKIMKDLPLMNGSTESILKALKARR